MNPRVSVIIPYYNTAAVVTETLDSVLAQTYTDFEVILVNDGSPDTADLERVLQPYLDRITYIRKENGGVSSARNRALGQARGELLALIDSDDLWMPDYLEIQVAKLDADPSADVVYPNCVSFGGGRDEGKTAMDTKTPPPAVTFMSLATVETFVVVSVMLRKSLLERIGLFDEALKRCEDFDLWLRCLKAGGRIICHNKVLLRYRRRPGSLSSDPAKMAADGAKVLRKTLATMVLTADEKATIERQIDTFDGNQLFNEAKHAFVAGDFTTAVTRLKAAGQLRKNGRIKWLVLALRVAPGPARAAYLWWYRKHPALSVAE